MESLIGKKWLLKKTVEFDNAQPKKFRPKMKRKC